MKFIIGFSDLNGYAAGGRIYISLRRDKRLLHGVRGMQTPNLQRCRSSSQKIFARQIFFGSPVFILVRTAMQLCPHRHISLRYVVAANFAFHASVLTHIRKLCFVASPLPTKILRLFVGALPYPVRPCRGLLRRIGLTCFFFSSPPKFIFCREPVRSSASLALFRQCKSPVAVRGRAASYYVD